MQKFPSKTAFFMVSLRRSSSVVWWSKAQNASNFNLLKKAFFFCFVSTAIEDFQRASSSSFFLKHILCPEAFCVSLWVKSFSPDIFSSKDFSGLNEFCCWGDNKNTYNICKCQQIPSRSLHPYSNDFICSSRLSIWCGSDTLLQNMGSLHIK